MDGRLQHLHLFLAARRRRKLAWNSVRTICSGAILACFALSITGGVQWAVYALPLSGLFMSVIYPTVNSKDISRVPKSEHGAAAGRDSLLYMSVGRLGSQAIGAVSDVMGRPIHGFMLATGFAAFAV
jgi:MFS transporter, DHA1 family, quinolone resistance protein